MQQPCATGLWSENGSHAFGGEASEWRIIDHHREMKNATQWGRARLDLFKKAPHVIGRANIRRHDARFHPSLLHVCHEFCGFRVRSAAATREHKMARTAVNQPPRQHLPVSAKRAGNEIASIRLHLESRSRQFTALWNKWGRKRYDH